MDIPQITHLVDQCAGEDIFIVGCGTSLSTFDWRRLKGKKTISLNNACMRFNPTYHLFVDCNIWERYRDMPFHETSAIITQHNGCKHLLYYPQCSFRDRVYECITTRDIREVKVDNAIVYTNYTVAGAALGLGWKLGASRCYLLGCDGYAVECWKGNRHWVANYFSDDISGHTQQYEPAQVTSYSREIDAVYEAMKMRGITMEVYQLNRNATTRAIPTVDMDDVL